jgi:hypothetical protein
MHSRSQISWLRRLGVLVASGSLTIATAPAALAGAWTLPRGQTQIISGVIFSDANSRFDNSGGAVPAAFQKFLFQSYAEYGLTNRVTLILAPEFAIAKELDATGHAIRGSDFALKAGARFRIASSFGVLSAEASIKTAGAFDMNVSAHNDSGYEGEFRLLYGTNFRLFKWGGYFDAEAAERWIAGSRPNETAVDLTAGIKFSPRYQVMVQSFNIVSGGDGRPPYSYYRSHKIEISVVQRLWHGVYLQSGSYYSPLGQNSLVEKGALAALWVRF